MTLHRTHRPQALEDVVGQEETVSSLEELASADELPHALLFTGPSGVGKTTLARIIAAELECQSTDVIEFDAATHSGAADVRQMTSVVNYHSFDDNRQMVIIDECHALSSQAWQALLKPIEEPPEHIYFAFCTTVPSKVPQTIRTRCHAYHLTEVSESKIQGLIESVAKKESISMEDWKYEQIARAAEGSPRQALVYLDMCRGAESDEDFFSLLRQPGQSAEVIDLCRLLVSARPSATAARDLLAKIRDKNPESARIQISAYLQKCVLGAKTEERMVHFLQILDHFSRPVTGMDSLMLAVFSAIFAGRE